MEYRNEISYAAIRRLPKYYRHLCNLRKAGIRQISSKELSFEIGVTSSQVRNDFAYFGGEGLPGIGYNVDLLKNKINEFLKSDNTLNMIIIGAGYLGHALAANKNLEKKGFKVIGIFDPYDQFTGREIKGIEIMKMDCLPLFIKRQHVDIAAITILSAHADEIIKDMISLGVKGIWNFSPVEVKNTDKVMIENSHLDDSLMVLGYNLKNK